MWNRRGQGTAEYAVLAAVVIGALLAMQIYMKQSAMGRLRDASDQLGERFDPTQHSSTLTRTSSGTRTEVTAATGGTTSTITVNEQQGSAGTESVDASSTPGKVF